MLVHLEVGLQLMHEAPQADSKIAVAAKNLQNALRWTLRAFALKKTPEVYVAQWVLFEDGAGADEADWNNEDADYLLQLFQGEYPDRWHFFAPYLGYLKVKPDYPYTSDELHRMAYCNLQVFELFMEDAVLYPYTYVQTAADRTFVNTYYEKRVLQVGKLLSQMDEYNYELTPGVFPGLQTKSITCPRCEATASLFGYYQSTSDTNFMACSMVCKTCRMLLFDIKELQLAGLPVVIHPISA